MTDKVQKIREEIARIQLYTQSEVLKQILDYIDEVQKESVSEDFEEALVQEWKGYNDRGAATVDALEDNTQELAFAKGFYHGWHYRKEEPVSEELGDYINELSKQFPEVSFAKLSRIAVRVAKWQKKQLLTKNAVKGVVHHFGDDEIAAIHYNDPKGVPMSYFISSDSLKAGDNVKLITIKED